jgi:shikimate dehydrogenase
MTAGLSGRARVAGVVGWPVGHSRSPRLHGYWLRRYGIDGAYVPLPVRAEAFARALRALADLGFAGCNVTVPHKEAALATCDAVSHTARAIGAVNTVVIRDGHLFGDNSDAFGFIENLRQEAPDWRPAAGPAVVLGAGGAARAVIHALLEAGVPALRLVNRTPERAELLARALDRDGRIVVAAWPQRATLLEDAGLVVNTTALGMVGQPPLELALDRLPPAALVTDIVYSPLETGLLARARQRGNPVVDGLGMLLHQARLGFRQWFGVEPAVDAELRRAVLDD